MMKRVILTLCAFLSFAGIATANAAGELVTLQSRPDATQSIYIETATANPQWVLLLYAGDYGDLHLSTDGPTRKRGNFVIRTAGYWLEHGDAVAMIDMPSDLPNGSGSGYRLSKDALADTAAAITEVRKRFPQAKVALLGTSRGTTSVANILNRQPDLADAYVLTSAVSSVTRKNGETANLHVDHPEKYHVLFVGNRNDGCRASPFAGGKDIAERNHSDFIAEESNQGGGDPESDCQAQSPHGYLGIETRVTDDINGWLNQRPQ